MKEKDQIFKNYRKKWFDNKLCEIGFKKYKSNKLARLTEDNVFQMVNFQKEATGYPEFYLNIVSRPLYLISFMNNLPLSPGFSIGKSVNNQYWFNYIIDSIPHESDFELAYQLFTEKAMPFFENTMDALKIIQSFENKIYPIYTWGHSPWIEFNLGLIYIRNKSIIKGLEHLEIANNLFSTERNPMLREFAPKCYSIIDSINSGLNMDMYFENTIKENKENLKILW